MLISIITPFRDRLELLTETIESVLDQSQSNWELLLINDNSKSSTEVLKQKFKYYPQIKLLSTKTRKGAAAARNIGIKAANGEYLIFLDSDDILLPYAIEQRTQAIETHQMPDGLIFNVKKINNEQIKQIDFYDKQQISYLPDWNVISQNPLNQFLKLKSPWQTSSGIWRKSWLLNQKIFFDEKLKIWQDVDFHIHILLKNPKLKILANHYPADVLYRQHTDTLSQIAYPFSYRKSQLYFFKKYLKRLKSTQYENIFKQTYYEFLDRLLQKKDKKLKLYIFASLYPVPLKFRIKSLKSLLN